MCDDRLAWSATQTPVVVDEHPGGQAHDIALDGPPAELFLDLGHEREADRGLGATGIGVEVASVSREPSPRSWGEPMQLSSQPMKSIAVTGAHGKTGRAVMAAVAPTWRIRALARNEVQAAALREVTQDVVVGDVNDRQTLASLVGDVDAVYHICPNFHPAEVEIGSLLADVAADVDQLIYHSVLHPQTEAMPHHWRKLRTEELLLERRRGRVTFLRPAPYVQNLVPYVREALAEGELRLPYSVDASTAMVDLADVGAAAVVSLEERFEPGSGWDLCGVGAVTHREIAARLSALSGRPIAAVQVPPPDGTPTEVRLMFDYMGVSGLPASTGQLRTLIGEPTALDTSLQRLVAGADR